MMPARVSSISRSNYTPSTGRQAYLIRALLLGTMSILLVFDTATGSFLEIIFFGDAALGVCLMVCFCVILVFVGIAFLQKDLFILTLFAALVALFLAYYLYFIVGASRPFNFNALGSWYGMLTIIVFYELAKRNLLSATIKVFFYVYAAYVLVYSVLVVLHTEGIFVPGVSHKMQVILNDPNRGSRLTILAVAPPYVAIYSIVKLQEKLRLRYFFIFGVAAFALAISLSRGMIICSVFVLALYIVTRRMTFVQYFSFLTYLLVCAYLVIGVFDPMFDPYSFEQFGHIDYRTKLRIPSHCAVYPRISVLWDRLTGCHPWADPLSREPGIPRGSWYTWNLVHVRPFWCWVNQHCWRLCRLHSKYQTV